MAALSYLSNRLLAYLPCHMESQASYAVVRTGIAEGPQPC